MGGDSTSLDSSLNYSTGESSLDQTFPENSLDSPTFISDFAKVSDEEVGRAFKDFEEFGRASLNSMDEVCQKQLRNVYMDVIKSYDELHLHKDHLKQAKDKILSYTPGSWIEEVGGMKVCHYIIPKKTTLLLIGPKGSGKSSLVNKISRVFEDDPCAPERAQVSYSSAGDGTYFLQEYSIPRGSSSFCLYDTRSLSDDLTENKKMVKHWMTKGVRHGELITRNSDDAYLESIARQNRYCPVETKGVNFVIFVVSAISILQSMDSDDETKRRQTQAVATTFNDPLLSFKDEKPVVVLTHGDLLSISDRTRIRMYLGQQLGIHPKKQIFDIPESDDSGTELTILNMLRYCLEHADKNLPFRKDPPPVNLPNFREGFWKLLVLYLLGCAVLGLLVIFVQVHVKVAQSHVNIGNATTVDSVPNLQPEVNKDGHANEVDSVCTLDPQVSKSDVNVEWGAIRHLWFDDV